MCEASSRAAFSAALSCISSAAASARVGSWSGIKLRMPVIGWRRTCAGINTSAQKLFGLPRRGRVAYPTGFHMDWLRLIRCLTQYVAPELAAVVVVAEIAGWLWGAPVSPSVTHTYHSLLLIVFSLLTAILIGICCWIVCLWDL